MNQTISIKAGATFSLAFLVALPSGTWTAESDLRRSNDVKIADLVATIAALVTPDASGNTHAGLLTASSAETALWPTGPHQCDVKFSDSSIVKISDSFGVTVEKAVTHA